MIFTTTEQLGHDFAAELTRALNAVFACRDVRTALATSCEKLGPLVGASRVMAMAFRTEKNKANIAVEWSNTPPNPDQDRVSLKIARHFQNADKQVGPYKLVSDIKDDDCCLAITPDLTSLGARSLALLSCRHAGRSYATMVFMFNETLTQDHPYLEGIRHRVAPLIGYVLAQLLNQQSMLRAIDRYQAALDHSVDALAQYDLRGNLIFANNKLEQLVRHSLKEIRGRHYSHIIKEIAHPQDESKVLEHYHQVFTDSKKRPPLDYKPRHQPHTGTVSLQDYVLPITDRKSRPIGYQSTITTVASARAQITEAPMLDKRYQRLIENSRFIFVEADSNFRLTFLSPTATLVLGLDAAKVHNPAQLPIADLAIGEDKDEIQRLCIEALANPQELDFEFRVKHHATDQILWLTAHLSPVFDRAVLTGWEGYALDISVRRATQHALELQTKRLTALYSVSSAIRGYLDPANIASRGLLGLVDATAAQAGVCYLYHAKDDHSRSLDLVAHHGFSGSLSDFDSNQGVFSSLSRYVAQYGKSIVVPDLRHDPRVRGFRAKKDELLSAVLVPITVDDEILGTIGLFSKRVKAFNSSDVLLVGAAANQIGLAARQANLFNAYKKQTKVLAALYRISHDLAGNMSLDDIIQRAFNIIVDELGIKRLWLGLLNEVGTKITGQAGFGPGWRKKLVHLSVELKGADHPFVQVIKARAPLLVENNVELLAAYGLKRIFSRLDVNTVILVPLVAQGAVVGIIAVQPQYDGVQLTEDDSHLLVNLANEIGVSVLNKRLENQLAENEKMRTAGILAAGVAHNFNNLLQAILGQASLLEMQSKNDKHVGHAAAIIHQAAVKGAGLVKQLLSFSQVEVPHQELTDINALILTNQKSLDSYQRQKQIITYRLSAANPQTYVDPNHLLRIVNVLVANAVDAVRFDGQVEIFTDIINISPESTQFEVAFGRYVRIGVRDNGVGMNAETKNRCFEPFFTTKSVDNVTGLSTTGAGMGLAAAYALARRNGGHLLVESEWGRGSTFTLYLPIKKPNEISNAPSESDAPAETPVGAELIEDWLSAEASPMTKPKR